ncbi:MAG: hypothetical protein KKC37_13765, partial [Proteobacteria bacterium]|nr:hypothetical protein [Pseudomonadota bacterium]
MPPKKGNKRLSPAEWAEIGRYVEEHPDEDLTSIAERFGIPDSTLRTKNRIRGWRTQKKTTETENDAAAKNDAKNDGKND